MKNKILIFGKGYLGSRLLDELDAAISERNISSIADAQSQITKFDPELIINCIGYIGKKNVDDCELDKEKTLLANVVVPIILAEAAIRCKVKMVHISSGCIYHYDYQRDSPISEEITPDFFDLYYSRSKIYSETALAVLSKKYPILIPRIRMPLDDRPHPRNILTKLVNIKKVIDLPNSITYIPDFIKALKHLINIDANGIYNVVNRGALKYPELMSMYKKYVPEFNYETVDFRKLNLVRTNLILSTQRLEKSGFKLRGIDEVLEECVKNYLLSA